MIKLVTIDIDDTLVNSAKEITPRVKAAIQAATAQGVKIVLTTGRPITGVQKYLDQLGLNHQDDQYVITYNGGAIETTNGTAIGGAPLSYAAYQQMTSVAADMETYLQVETLTAAYTTSRDVPHSASRENFMVDMDLYVRDVAEMDPADHYVKFMFIGKPEQVDHVQQNLPADLKAQYNFVKSAPDFLEVLNKQASKGNALRALADHLGIKIEETMAIGDQENDLSMIEAAGMGVAMGNAIDAIKQAAQVETTTQNNDGVGHALEKWVLQEG